MTMNSAEAHTVTDINGGLAGSEPREEVMERKRWKHEFETGWYLPGIEDPEVLKAELDPVEDAQKPTGDELYEMIVRDLKQETEAPVADSSS